MRFFSSYCRCLVLFSCLLCASLSFANPYSDNQFDWAKTLELSTQQQQQIKDIEKKYRTEHKQLRIQDCQPQDKLSASSTELDQQMHLDIHNVLTPTQKQQASEIIQTQHRQMQLGHAREVAHQLNLDKAQRKAFLDAIEDVEYSYQWPLNVQQRELARNVFEQVLMQQLNSDQLQQWQELSNKKSNRWHSPAEFQPKCSATS